MSLAGKQNKPERLLPRVEFVADGVAVTSYPSHQIRGWHRRDYEDRVTMSILLNLRGAYDVSEHQRPGWVLELSRDRVTRGRWSNKLRNVYAATVRYSDNRVDDGQAFNVMRGTCQRWADAVEEVSQYGGGVILHMMRESGQRTYGRNGADWNLLRPFVARWSWDDPEEPNFKYTSFKLPPGVAFDGVSDGALACVYGWDRQDTKNFASKLQCNAFLREHDGPTGWAVYHRNYMSEPDPIDIDDWRARIIASAE